LIGIVLLQPRSESLHDYVILLSFPEMLT
jgi:hypothetical protein